MKDGWNCWDVWPERQVSKAMKHHLLRNFYYTHPNSCIFRVWGTEAECMAWAHRSRSLITRPLEAPPMPWLFSSGLRRWLLFVSCGWGCVFIDSLLGSTGLSCPLIYTDIWLWSHKSLQNIRQTSDECCHKRAVSLKPHYQPNPTPISWEGSAITWVEKDGIQNKFV